MMWLLLEMCVVMAVILALDRLPSPHGVILLAMFVGSNQYLQTILAATVYVQPVDGVLVSPGSAVLFTASIVVVLLIYVRHDIEHTRTVIYGIVGCNLSLTLLTLFTWLQLSSGATNILRVPQELFQVDPRVFLAGTLVLVVDSFLVVVVYEGLRARLPSVPAQVRVVLALVMTLAVDSTVFSALAFGGTELFRPVLVSQLIGKSIAGLAYGGALVTWITVWPPARITSSELRDPFAILTYRRQLSAERQAHRATVEASDAKSRFLARMSHELRTPLNSIIGFSAQLAKERTGTLTASQAKFVSRIEANGHHLLQLINDLLDVSQIEAGEVTAHLSEVDLGDLVRGTVLEMHGLVPAGGDVQLQTDLPHGPLIVTTDPLRLKQVLVNLVGNALKFTADGEVVVSVGVDADQLPQWLEVRDTGIGMSAEQLGPIFERFRQADETTSRRFGGTGLGLSISKTLCELMGHLIEVESTQGVGSVFRVRFVADPAREHAA